MVRERNALARTLLKADGGHVEVDAPRRWRRAHRDKNASALPRSRSRNRRKTRSRNGVPAADYAELVGIRTGVRRAPQRSSREDKVDRRASSCPALMSADGLRRWSLPGDAVGAPQEASSTLQPLPAAPPTVSPLSAIVAILPGLAEHPFDAEADGMAAHTAFAHALPGCATTAGPPSPPTFPRFRIDSTCRKRGHCARRPFDLESGSQTRGALETVPGPSAGAPLAACAGLMLVYADYSAPRRGRASDEVGCRAR